MTSLTSSIQVSEEMIAAGVVEAGNTAHCSYGQMVKAIYLAMKAAEPLAQGDDATEQLIDALVQAAWQEDGPRGIERLAKAKANVRAALVRSKLPDWDRIERVLWGVRDGSITPESAKQHIITAIGSQSIEGERG